MMAVDTSDNEQNEIEVGSDISMDKAKGKIRANNAEVELDSDDSIFDGDSDDDHFSARNEDEDIDAGIQDFEREDDSDEEFDEEMVIEQPFGDDVENAYDGAALLDIESEDILAGTVEGGEEYAPVSLEPISLKNVLPSALMITGILFMGEMVGMTLSNLASDGIDDDERFGRSQAAINYFARSTKRPSKPSRNLTRLTMMSSADVYETLCNWRPDDHPEGRSKLLKKYQDVMAQWRFELEAGMSILLYGYGSKRMLVGNFIDAWLGDMHVFEIDGFHSRPQTAETFKKAIEVFCGNPKGIKLGGGIQDIASTLVEVLDKDSLFQGFVVFVIHCLDGMAMRAEAVQQALGILGGSSKIRILASVDHIQSGMLWNRKLSERLNFIWHECPTYEPYLEEALYLDVKGANGPNGISSVRGASFVLQSLPKNALTVFGILAAHQLSQSSDNSDGGEIQSTIGLSYADLFRKAYEQFAISSDAQLRTLLTEFTDHELVKSNVTVSGTEIMFIPFDCEEIKQILGKIAG